MEKLNSDEKIMILNNLSVNDIVNVCKVNKDLSRICSDSRYNSLWINKIKEDFETSLNKDYHGNNAYREYKRLYTLLKTRIYQLQIITDGDSENHFYVFLNEDKAVDFACSYFCEEKFGYKNRETEKMEKKVLKYKNKFYRLKSEGYLDFRYMEFRLYGIYLK